MASKKEDTIKIDPSEITILPAEIEEKVNAEIGLIRVEANVTEEFIKKLTEEYGGLKIKDQADKEGYLAVQEARKTVKKIRVAAGKLFDKGREEAVAIADKWLDSKKKVIASLSAIEEPLEEQEDAYEAEDKRIKAEKARKLEQQGIKRTSELMSYGASLIDGNWVLGELAYESILCKNCDEDIYQGIREQYKALFDVKESARIQKEADDKAAADKLLADQQAVAKAKEEAKKMRTEARISFLESLGMEKSKTGGSYAYAGHTVLLMDIQEQETQDWEVILAGVREGIEKAKALAKEEERVKEVFKQRLSLLKEWSSDGQYVNGSFTQGKNWGTIKQLVDLPEEEFDNLIGENEKFIDERDKRVEAKRLKDIEDARLEGIGKSRRNDLILIQANYAGTDIELGDMSNENWASFYMAFKKNYDEAQKVIADQKEKDRLEELGEKGRYEELVKYLKASPIGEFRSSQYRTKVSPIRTFINNL